MSLSDKMWEGNRDSIWINTKDFKKFIQEDYKNIVLAKRKEISWQQYLRRRIELLGDKLI